MQKNITFTAIAIYIAFWVIGFTGGVGNAADNLKVASFNIQFLGHFKDRDNEALANLLSTYDLVFIQELVAPPYPGSFLDGAPFKPDKEARDFFEAMKSKGFNFILSDEDTGTGDEIHINSPATEWFVAFYRPDKVAVDASLFTGFISNDRSNNHNYERVPYAFAFQAGSRDFVIISTHLQPGKTKKDKTRRRQEFAAIFRWIDAQPGDEKDYIVLGDMNIESCAELEGILPKGYATLNDRFLATNTSMKSPKPYDHVIFHKNHSADEIHTQQKFRVVNLISEMSFHWPENQGLFPGEPYDHNAFRMRYSDHHSIEFLIYIAGEDDD